MNSSFYEVWVQPDSGPVVVSERDDSNMFAWTTEARAVDVAILKKRRYPHMDFIVHKVTGHEREVVFRTKDCFSPAKKASNPSEGSATKQES